MINDPVFRKLGTVARVAALDREERRDYERSLKAYRDSYAILTTERQEGFEEGKAEGRAEGRAEAVVELIKKLHSNGLSAPEIAGITGYTSAEVESFLKA